MLEKANAKMLTQTNFFEEMAAQDPQQVNEFAEKVLKEILEHPQKTMIQSELARFGSVVDIYDPNGRGARYLAFGEFIGFLEAK